MERRKYIIATGTDVNELQRSVNSYIEQGYLPIGGTGVYYQGMTSPEGLTQAMVARELMA